MVDNPPPPNLPPPPPPPVSVPSMRAQGGEIKGPLGLWSFPVLNSLSSSMRSEGVEVTGPLGMWSFPILSSVLSGSQIRISFGPGRSSGR